MQVESNAVNFDLRETLTACALEVLHELSRKGV